MCIRDRTYLGHNGLSLCNSSGYPFGSHGTLVYQRDGNLSEAFQQQKD